MKDFLNILKYIIPYKRYAFLNIFFNVISTIFSLFSFTLVIPFLGILFKTQPIITEAKPLDITSMENLQYNFNYWLSQIIIDKGELQALLTIGIIVIIATFFKTATFYLANHFMVPIRNGVVKDIRNELFNKIINLHIGYYSDEKKGNIIARMTNDVQEIEWGIMSSLEMLFRDPIKIIIFLASMIFLSWKLTLFVMILLPLTGFITGQVGKTLRKTSLTGQQQMGNLMAQIEEMIGGLRIVKAFNAEDYLNNRFRETNSAYTHTMNKINRKRFIAGPLTEFLATVSIVVIMWYGGSMILGENSTMSSQELIGYLIIFSQIIVPAKTLSTSWFNVKKAMASVDRINDILKAKNPIVDAPKPVSKTTFEDSIEFKNVSFSYNELPVLKNINLKIYKGQKVAIVGQSGSGKSTLVDLIPRFFDINDGEILIDGINIKNIKIKDLRNLIGYVNQNPILFNDSIYNNIAFGIKNAEMSKVIKAAIIANADEFINKTEEKYFSNIGDGGGKLSGGQKQRLSIARAILKNPPILILDEATSALDTESEKLVQNALEELMKNRTSIIIAHRLSTIRNADIIYVINNGEIVEQGTHNQLINNKSYYFKLNSLQNTNS